MQFLMEGPPPPQNCPNKHPLFQPTLQPSNKSRLLLAQSNSLGQGIPPITLTHGGKCMDGQHGGNARIYPAFCVLDERERGCLLGEKNALRGKLKAFSLISIKSPICGRPPPPQYAKFLEGGGCLLGHTTVLVNNNHINDINTDILLFVVLLILLIV